jgi:sporulation protein YlmC with PRC-barrel domain
MGRSANVPFVPPTDLTSSIPPAADPNAPGGSPTSASGDRLWLRSELMGTQVITRDTGRRLGVVGEVVVDIDRREVVALGLRDNPLTRFLPGLPRWMPLDRIRQVGDVILVDSADSLEEGFNPERYSKVINCQVVTESGEQLGRVLGFSFDIETGELTTLVIGALGVPLLGEGVLSTWELPVGEIVSSGTDRIIVYEGAEEKLKQLGTGLLEKLGIGGGGLEQEERERFRSGVVPAENQLPAGQPSVAEEQRRIQPARSRAFEPRSELEYVELEERREREPLRQRRYLDDEPEPGRSESGRGGRYGSDRGDDRYPPIRDERDRFGEDRFDDERSADERLAGDRFERDRVERERFRQERVDRDRLDQDRLEPDRPTRVRSDADRPGADRFDGDWDDSGRRRSLEDQPRDPGDRERQPEPGWSRGERAEQPYPSQSSDRQGNDPLPRRRPSAERSGAEPIDVEPEVIDDPW